MTDLLDRLRSPIRYPGIEDEAADQIDGLVNVLQAVQGRIMNARIDLQTGHTKAAALKTLQGIVEFIDGAIAAVSEAKGETNG